MTSTGIDALYEHADFVRRLARSLVADENKAHDLEQETWLAAMKRPAGDPSGLKAWLATVMRNVLRQDQRSSIRREKREELAPAKGESAATERTLLRQELAKQITDSVKQLDMPYRTVISMRFYEDLSPREIAQQIDLPLETVRTRMKRALQQISANLDRQHGGVRSRWSAAVVSAFGLHQPGTAAASGAALTKAKGITAMVPELKLALGGLVFAALVMTGMNLLGPTDTDPVEVVGSHQKAEVSSGAITPDSESPEALQAEAGKEDSPSNRVETAPFGAQPAKESSRDRSPPIDSESARIVGRLLSPDGSPIAGATLNLKGLDKTKDPVRAFGAIEPTHLKRSVTDDEGQFEISLSPNPSSQYILEADDGAHGIVDWCFRSLNAKSVTDLGDYRLPAVGTVTGQIQDMNGQFVGGLWMITCSPVAGGEPLIIPRNLLAGTNPDDGKFSIERVPVGEVIITAMHAGLATNLKSSPLRVSRGKVTNGILKLPNPGQAGGIMVTVQADLPLVRAATEVLLQRGGVTVEAAASAQATVQQGVLVYRFSDIEPGEYRVVVRNPHYSKFVSDQVQVGGVIRASLQGDVQLRIQAKTPEGKALENFHVRLSPLVGDANETAANNSIQGFTQDSSEWRFKGLPACDFVAEIRSREYPTQSFNITSLRTGENREVMLTLSRGKELMGRVLHRKAVIGSSAKVHIATAASQGGYPGFDYEFSDLKLSDNGEFSLPPLATGSYLVTVALNEVSRIEKVVEIRAGGPAANQPLLFDFTAHGSLRGKLIAPPGRATSGLRVGLIAAKAWDNPETRYDADHYFVPVDADGRFYFASVPAGEMVGFLELTPDEKAGNLPQTWTAHPECGRVVIQGGVVNEHNFSVQALYPGEAKIGFSLKGAQSQSVRVKFQLVGRKDLVFESTALFDAKQQATVKNLTPGTYRVTIRPTAINQWVYRHAEVITVTPGASIDLMASVEVVTGVLHFVDRDTNKSMKNREIKWSLRRGSHGGRFKTDANGSVELALTPDEYYFYDSYEYHNLIEHKDWKTAWPVAPGQSQTLRIK